VNSINININVSIAKENDGNYVVCPQRNRNLKKAIIDTLTT
jgi:hypothetical protein